MPRVPESLLLVLGVSLFMLWLPPTGSAQESVSRPNILLLLADDLGQGDLGCYNPESKIPTPRLDAFAAEGMRWTDAHSPSAVCTPTRYGVLTGRYCWRSRLKSGVLMGYDPALIEEGRPTIASRLAAAGYRTAAIGKWHLGLGADKRTRYDQPLKPSPLDFGFQSFFGIAASLDMPPYVYLRDRGPVQPASGRIEGSKAARGGGGGFWRAGEISADFRHDQVLPRVTAEAVHFLEAQKGSRQPFFLYLPLTAPHTPWLPAPAFRGRSGAGSYGDFTAMVDAAIGEVLDALERSGHRQDTLVVVTSDNGAHWTPADKARFGHLANHHRRGQKADAWEGGHRIPFLVRWPGRVRAGSTTDALLCLTDFYATLSAAAGVPVQVGEKIGGEDSVDQLPVLLAKSEVPAPRQAIVHHSHRGLFAVRRGPWKLILGLGSGGFSLPHEQKPVEGGPQGQLYRLDQDPTESRNLWLQHPEVVAELTALLAGYRTSGRSVGR